MWYVWSGGDVYHGGYVYLNSYGFSPGTDSAIDVCIISRYGLGSKVNHNLETFSYGSPGTNYSKGAWSILSSGNSENTSSGYNIDLSYGLFYQHSYIYTNCKKGAMKYETT